MTFHIFNVPKKFISTTLTFLFFTSMYAQKHDPQEILTLINTERSGIRNMEPCWSPDGKKIAFMSIRDDNGDIYVMNADGTAQRNLTNHPGGDGEPQWSPDGSKILWSSNRTGTGRIFTMNADGSDAMELTHTNIYEITPAWSPDGKKIAYGSGLSHNTLIFITNANGIGTEQATASASNLSSPIWSPDGKTISCLSAGVGGFYSLLINLTDHTSKPYEKDPNASVIHRGWSADGTRAFFTSSVMSPSRKRITKIYFTDSKTGKKNNVLKNLTDVISVEPAPDGNRILYSTKKSVFVVDVAQKKTIEIGSNHHSAKWSPDSQTILMVSRDVVNIFTVKPDGTSLMQLTK